MSTPETIHFVHIGKTGGTFFKSVLDHNEGKSTRPLNYLHHKNTLASTREKFGPDRKVAFLVRDPADRFVSAFASRLRQGRPTYDGKATYWSAAEAAAFLWFPTANSLAEALGSEDERMKSAAQFSMEAIAHLQRNYAYHLGNVKALREEHEAGNIVAVMDTSELNSRMPELMNRLSYPTFDMPEKPRTHKSTMAPETLSPLALKNLKAFWRRDFNLYKECRTISDVLFGKTAPESA